MAPPPFSPQKTPIQKLKVSHSKHVPAERVELAYAQSPPASPPFDLPPPAYDAAVHYRKIFINT